MPRAVCSIDLGSSAIKAGLVDEGGRILAIQSIPAPALEGEDARFDALEYEQAVCSAVRALVEQCDMARHLEGISLSSQRATLVLAGASGDPVGPALSWQGTACAGSADAFYGTFGPDRFHETTGLPPGAIYSVPKLAHMKATGSGRLEHASTVCTLHDWILARMGGGEVVTDHSNASATGLYDIARRDWSGQILDALGLDSRKLPSIVDCGSSCGTLSERWSRRTGLAAGTPVFVGGGDQQCACIGAGALHPGQCVFSLGTAAAVMAPLTELPSWRRRGLLIMAHLTDGMWQVEGFINAWGSALSWVSRMLGCTSIDEMEALAGDPDSESPVLFLPFLAGVGSPDMDDAMRASFVGMGLTTTRAQLARGVLVGLGCEARRVAEALGCAVRVTRLMVVGGGGGRGALMRTIANVTGLPMEASDTEQSAVVGAAASAWCGVSRLESPLEAARRFVSRDALPVPPGPDGGRFENDYLRYCDTLERLRNAPERGRG